MLSPLYRSFLFYPKHLAVMLLTFIKYIIPFLLVTGSFDVYNIETAMPHIDLDAIESHLRAAREEERRVST